MDTGAAVAAQATKLELFSREAQHPMQSRKDFDKIVHWSWLQAPDNTAIWL